MPVVVAIIDRFGSWFHRMFEDHPVLSFTAMFVLWAIVSIWAWKTRHLGDGDWD